ncbi:hypothetical protein FACS189459_1400 [Bacilli bacterium]|nr:hypothetical protein FACS189459_1400 [Bacilli bacterium]
MTNQEYLQKIINKYKKTQKFNSEEERLFNLFKNKIESWFNTNSFKYGNPTLEIKQSGSKAKGTAIIGHSDIDLFLSITDRNNTDSLKNFFIDIRDYLKTFT